MKITSSVLLSLLFLVAPAQISAEENLLSRINAIYQSYQETPEQSCRELETVLTASNLTKIDDKNAKKAYYFLANCQYQLHDLDKALIYYKKVASIDPVDPQPLIDAGSVSIEKGSYSTARKLYEQALQRVEGNAAETQRIQNIIKNTPEQFQKRYSVFSAIGYDSNVNSGPKDTNHLIYDSFSYTLTSDDKRRDDMYVNNGISAAFNKTLNPKTDLLFNLSGNYTNYFEESDYDTALVSASMGFRKIHGNKSVTLTPYVNYQTFNKDSYQITSGLYLGGWARVSDKVNIWPSIGWYTQDFFEDDRRDAHAFSLGNSTSYQFNTNTSVVGSLFYTYSNASNNQFTYNNVYLDGHLVRTLTEDLTATLGYTLQLYYYDDADPAFGSSREDDGHKFYLSLNYSLKHFIKDHDAALNFNLSANQNNSNHSLQENDRFFSSLQLILYF